MKLFVVISLPISALAWPQIKIHGTCPGELPDVVKQLEESTGSVVVGQIGRSVILYRPSVTKLKAEEKRNQDRGVYVRKGAIIKPKLPVRLCPQHGLMI